MTQKDIKRVQHIADMLTTLIEDLEQQVYEREDVYDSRSEKWQESEKGEMYRDETLELEDDKDRLQSALDEIDIILDKWT